METDKDERESLKNRGRLVRCQGGFTFVELMVVVAIMAILAGTVSVGWHSFSDFIAFQNATGTIEDILDEITTDHLRDEYKETSVWFESEYLLVDSVSHEARLTLGWEKVSAAVGDCAVGDIKLKSPVTAQFFANDGEGNPLFDSVPLQADEEFCIDPLEYKEREMVYELQTDEDFSNRLRVFPIDRSFSGSGGITIEPNSYRVDILQPYPRKRRYENGILLDKDATASITVRLQGSEETADFLLKEN